LWDHNTADTSFPKDPQAVSFLARVMSELAIMSKRTSSANGGESLRMNSMMSHLIRQKTIDVIPLRSGGGSTMSGL
jgi:hypothetical protein